MTAHPMTRTVRLRRDWLRLWYFTAPTSLEPLTDPKAIAGWWVREANARQAAEKAGFVVLDGRPRRVVA